MLSSKRVLIQKLTGILIGIWIYFRFGLMSVQAKSSQATVLANQYFDFTPLFWVIVIVGGCIVITLTYVSYRKYKGEKKKHKEKDNKQECKTEQNN